MSKFRNILMEAKMEEGSEQSVEHSEMEGLCRTKILKSYRFYF